MTSTTLPVALTGDRPSGCLHLGHMAGSVLTRVAMQKESDLLVMIADMQALTDHSRDPGLVKASVMEVMADYLAVGLDPEKATLFLQSGVPAIDRLSMLYLNLVTVARLERNPTVRAEMAQKGMERDVPAGFLSYPAAQAADITAFRATLVPVGDDQAPMIELAVEIVRRVNAIAGRDLLPEPKAVHSAVGRLPGVDGQAKASKSLGNAIRIGADANELRAQIMRMYTDADHLRISDPGRVEGNVVFSYLEAFDPSRDEVEELKAHYRRGGLGDMTLKRRLADVLENMLAPIRERRMAAVARPADLFDMLRDGTRLAAARAAETVAEIEDALGVMRL